MDIDWDIIARLLVAAGLGAAIGFEREAADQPAGLRTHMAVTIGAALFGVISTTGFSEFETARASTNVQLDVTRVASLVASGIGFIGAGLIFRQGTTVRNLTTAASVWVAAAIGLACGVGDFAPAIATTIVVLVTLVLLRIPRAWIRHFFRSSREDVRIVVRRGESERSVFDALQGIEHLHVDEYGVEKDDGAYVVTTRLSAKHGRSVRQLLTPISHLDVVTTLQFGGSPGE